MSVHFPNLLVNICIDPQEWYFIDSICIFIPLFPKIIKYNLTLVHSSQNRANIVRNQTGKYTHLELSLVTRLMGLIALLSC